MSGPGERGGGMAERVPRNRRLTGEARVRLAAEMREAYDAGASIRAIAESTGRSYGSVKRMLDESETRYRSCGGARTRREHGVGDA